MTITLTPEQQAWIEAHVARGEFASVSDAVREMVDARITELALLEADDLSWAKPLVNDALAEVAKGDVLTLDEYEARIAARFGQ